MAFHPLVLSLLVTAGNALFHVSRHRNLKDNANEEPAVKGRLFPHNKSATFKILQLADLHLGEKVHIVGDQDNRSLAAVQTLLDMEKPDLVVLSGDVITGEDLYTPEERHRTFDRIADILENRSIPWAFVFGNHDAANSPMQGPLHVESLSRVAGQNVLPISLKVGRGTRNDPGAHTKELSGDLGNQVGDIFQDPGSVHEPKAAKAPPAKGPAPINTDYGWVPSSSRKDPVKAPKRSAPRENFFEHERAFNFSRTGWEGFFVGQDGTLTNYYLKVYASSEDAEADRPSVLLWFLDTGGGTVPATLEADQILWLRSAHHDLVAKYGPLPGMLFAHVPFMEYKHVDPHDRKCTGFSDDQVSITESGDDGSGNGSILSLVVDLQIDWIFVGHDHGNDWCCPIRVDNGPKGAGGRNGASSRDIQLCYGRHSGYGGYSTPNVHLPGARVVQFEPTMLRKFIQGQSSSSTTNTWVRLEGGMVVSSSPDDPFTRALMKDTNPVPVLARPMSEPWV